MESALLVYFVSFRRSVYLNSGKLSKNKQQKENYEVSYDSISLLTKSKRETPVVEMFGALFCCDAIAASITDQATWQQVMGQCQLCQSNGKTGAYQSIAKPVISPVYGLCCDMQCGKTLV